MMDCIFCKIAAGEIPSYTLYEDDSFKVILDIAPATIGHTIIISKEHAENIYELSDKSLAELMPLVQRAARAIKEGLGCEGLNILQNNGEAAGQTVNHFHVHLIPRNKDDGIIMKWTANKPAEEDFKQVLGKIII